MRSNPSTTVNTEKMSGHEKKVDEDEAASSQKEMCSKKQASM